MFRKLTPHLSKSVLDLFLFTMFTTIISVVFLLRLYEVNVVLFHFRLSIPSRRRSRKRCKHRLGNNVNWNFFSGKKQNQLTVIKSVFQCNLLQTFVYTRGQLGPLSVCGPRIKVTQLKKLFVYHSHLDLLTISVNTTSRYYAKKLFLISWEVDCSCFLLSS